MIYLIDHDSRVRENSEVVIVYREMTWLVVSTLLKNISQLVLLFHTIPNIWKSKTCSKPPPSQLWFLNNFYKLDSSWAVTQQVASGPADSTPLALTPFFRKSCGRNNEERAGDGDVDIV